MTEEQTTKILEPSPKICESSIRENSLECVIELDDFYAFCPGLNELLTLKKHFPGFKITLFTIPFPAIFMYKGIANDFNMKKYRDWVNVIKQLDWIEIAVHGVGHLKNEFNCSKIRAKKSLLAIDNVFKRVGLPYVKIFRAPYWQLSQDALDVLSEEGWTIALNPEVPQTFNTKDKMVYYFNWNLKDKYPEGSPLFGHGHLQDPINGIDKVLSNILELPTNTVFKKLSEQL